MSECQHPLSSQYVDRVRGQTSCMLCGQVLSDQHFELDPAFARGDRGTGGGGGMRTAGFARPTRPQTAHGAHGLHRPSLDAARRQLTAIARKLSITPLQVDVAASVFKMAVTANAVVGARSAVLCACLYIVCRRQQSATPLTVLDFSDVTGDSPFAIITYLRTICKATNTQVPPVDSVFYVARLCQLLEIPSDVMEAVAVYAMKVMRAMKDDWITVGRRPLGVAAAAVLVACQVHGVPVDLPGLADLVRLNQFTIVLRVEEFAATPTASLSCIDEYNAADAGSATSPAAFLKGRRTESEYVLADELRELSALYYELINEARAGAPCTPERTAKWKRFIDAKSQSSGVPVEQLPHALAALTPAQQLLALGVGPKGVKDEDKKPEPELAAEQASQLLTGSEVLQALNNLPDPSQAPATLPAQVATQPLQQQPAGMAGVKAGVPFAAGPPAFELLDLGDASDIEDEYIIYDNEARIRSQKANESAYKEEWARVGSKYTALVRQERAAEDETGDPASAGRRGQRGGGARSAPVVQAATALESLTRALKTRGGGHIDTDRLSELLPGIDDVTLFDDDFGGGFLDVTQHHDRGLVRDRLYSSTAPPAGVTQPAMGDGRPASTRGKRSAASEGSLQIDADEFLME